MPRPTMPPTPISSTEMKGQDDSHQLSALQVSFELPPSAVGSTDSSTSPSSDMRPPTNTSSHPQMTSPNMSYPVQPSETVKSRRRASAAQRDTFALPPPPTRSRKIIQMKPKSPDEPVKPSTQTKTAQGASKGQTGAAVKKKQPSATSAAGRKIARKTAHSLIERRRRSKMNEEFAVLKDLIPACTGEMHKLAILQASIEYVRYLEDCIAQLKNAQQGSHSSTPIPAGFVLPPPASQEVYNSESRQDSVDDESGDVEMSGSGITSPTSFSGTPQSQHPSVSPVLLSEDAHARHSSYSSVSTDPRRYSYSTSAVTSPAFGPQTYPYPLGTISASNSTLTSPALAPQRDLDQEASAALLMLNTDRRGTSSHGAGRGMSVHDLLSA